MVFLLLPLNPSICPSVGQSLIRSDYTAEFQIHFSARGGMDIGRMTRDSITTIGIDSIVYFMKTDFELKDIL